MRLRNTVGPTIMMSLGRWLPIVLALLVAMIVLAWQIFVLPVPEGLGGQPRSGQMPATWTAPVWLIVAFWLGLTATLTTVLSPLWGVAVYCCVLYLLPVHTPAWIYLLWLQLPSLIAGVTLIAWLGQMHSESDRLNNLSRIVSCFGAGVFLWYGIAILVQFFEGQVWRPPLQFHPLRIFDAMVIFLVAATAPVRLHALRLVVIAMSATVVVRFFWVQTSVRTDGDIAAIATLTGVTAGALGLIERSILSRLAFAGVTVCCGVIVWQTQNRAALLAVAAASLAALICARRRGIGLLVVAVVALGGWQLFADSNYARRFEAGFASLEAIANSARMRTWAGGLEMALEHPLTGVGPGNFVYHIGDYDPDFTHHSAHNALVSAAAETGFPGALFLAGLILGCLLRALLCATQYRQTTALVLACGIAAYITLTTFLSFTFLAFAYFLMGLTLADDTPPGRA
ncbi:MAG: O-antigen ligase family protein [Pseudomonadota bacterium]